MTWPGRGQKKGNSENVKWTNLVWALKKDLRKVFLQVKSQTKALAIRNVEIPWMGKVPSQVSCHLRQTQQSMKEEYRECPMSASSLSKITCT